MARTKSQEKYEAIMASTLKLSVQHGLQWLSMSKIAKDAGVVPATIYVYFDNIESILNKLYLESKSKLAGNLDGIIKAELGYRDNARIIWYSIFDNLIAHPTEFQFLEQCGASPIITQETRSQGMNLFAPMVTYILGGVEAGAIKNMRLELLHALFYSPITMLVEQVLFNGLELDEQHKEQVFESTWIGICN